MAPIVHSTERFNWITALIGRLLEFYILATSKVISGSVSTVIMTVHTHYEFIVLPHWKIRLPIP